MRGEISTKSTSTSSSRRRCRTTVRSIQLPGTTSSPRTALEVDEEAGELHEQREGERIPTIVIR